VVRDDLGRQWNLRAGADNVFRYSGLGLHTAEPQHRRGVSLPISRPKI